MSAVILTAALLLPVHPHTVTELLDWKADWAARADVSLSPALMAEWADMTARHLWYFDPPAPAQASSGAAVDRVLAAPPPPPAPRVYSAGVEQWRTAVAHFWPASEVDTILRIIGCESGGDPYVPNAGGSGALGLLQIMPFWQRVWPGDYTDPWTNLSVGYQIWLSQGYGAWRASAGCW